MSLLQTKITSFFKMGPAKSSSPSEANDSCCQSLVEQRKRQATKGEEIAQRMRQSMLSKKHENPMTEAEVFPQFPRVTIHQISQTHTLPLPMQYSHWSRSKRQQLLKSDAKMQSQNQVNSNTKSLGSQSIIRNAVQEKIRFAMHEIRAKQEISFPMKYNHWEVAKNDEGIKVTPAKQDLSEVNQYSKAFSDQINAYQLQAENKKRKSPKQNNSESKNLNQETNVLIQAQKLASTNQKSQAMECEQRQQSIVLPSNTEQRYIIESTILKNTQTNQCEIRMRNHLEWSFFDKGQRAVWVSGQQILKLNPSWLQGYFLKYL